jgi:hypothetical protein
LPKSKSFDLSGAGVIDAKVAQPEFARSARRADGVVATARVECPIPMKFGVMHFGAAAAAPYRR